jgi:hypothetical protein
MKLEDIENRLKELPELLKTLEAERNQLLGYRQALLDSEDEDKEKKETKNK